MSGEPEIGAFQRGKDAGRIDQQLAQHSSHLERINGSVERFAQEMSLLAAEIRKQAQQAELREERVITAAETLAKETERRRSELEDKTVVSDRQFTKRERVLALALTLLGLVATVLLSQYPWN